MQLQWTTSISSTNEQTLHRRTYHSKFHQYTTLYINFNIKFHTHICRTINRQIKLQYTILRAARTLSAFIISKLSYNNVYRQYKNNSLNTVTCVYALLTQYNIMQNYIFRSLFRTDKCSTFGQSRARKFVLKTFRRHQTLHQEAMLAQFCLPASVPKTYYHTNTSTITHQ